MSHEKHRYFIELQPNEGIPPTRSRETELRRELAASFIELISQWLQEQELGNKVSTMAITALGQVQITCEADVIHQMRNQDDLNIAAIRQGAAYVDGIGRWG